MKFEVINYIYLTISKVDSNFLSKVISATKLMNNQPKQLLKTKNDAHTLS